MLNGNKRTNGDRSEVRILFLGQCLQYGYEGVDRNATFPSLALPALKTQFPGLGFKVDLKYLYHPVGLKALLRRRLTLTRPDLAVIGLPALFAATQWRVNLIYELAPELVDTARAFMQRVEAKVKRQRKPMAATLLDRTVAWRAPIALDEYERLVEEAITDSMQISSCRFILMGPGRFNEDTRETYHFHSPELWSAVNRMLIGLAQRLRLPFINAHDTLDEYGREVFLLNNHRFSTFGHQVIAREVASVLGAQVTVMSFNGK